jgi:glycosyltransferase involved in cell wall biosynthesis
MIWSQTVGPIGARAVLYASRKGVPAACYVHSIEWELVSMSISRPYLSRLIVAFIRYLTRWIYNKASLLMVPSMEVSHLLERNNVRTRKELVRMGIDSAKFRPPESKEEAKRMIGMDPRDLVIGFIGRIGREKGLMTLYDAFVRNRNEFGSARLLIVGSGLSDWENVFRSAPGVKLVGATNHAVDYIQAMDIYVLPSFTETTSLSTLEAMSCGCAVLSTKVGLAKRYIKDKVNGSFFPAGNDTVLRLKLKWLIESPELRESMGESARRTVITSFDWSKTSEGVKRSLRSLG